MSWKYLCGTALVLGCLWRGSVFYCYCSGPGMVNGIMVSSSGTMMVQE